jgi:glycerol uptake facilitator-like aquaporin
MRSEADAGIAIDHVPGFIVAQLIGAAAGGFVAAVLVSTRGAAD